MATAGAPWPGAVLGLALLTGVLVTGCAESGTTGGPAGGRNSSSPSATPPEELCAKVVAYWSRETLDGDTYGDYQSMGLSNGQYEILREVVDAARAENKRRGADAAERLIDRRARAGCAEWYRAGGPGEGPWQ
ncbi:hypothetical protein JIX56_35020 [Streptomyces sp. CA-210063]|uniref:hypothetical protein n=1 Tax=Streptomyces sp. CA-210063 TaxID=2801029 RepID=UPI00214B8609|nr:hypothetical protein [Streptomyces sp. CA-210063]UUU34649.1 hypothetical protein JIX56_35020 [Streptomyces sp. CA-210063]